MIEVGLLGGTFDPVHNGHLQLAETVLDEYRLEKIVFIPAARPPHKNYTFISDIEHRLLMLRSALAGESRYEVSGIELTRSEPSYTFDTLQRLQKQSGGDVTFHFIIGHDAFLEIETWYRWQRVLTTSHFIIAVRPGYPVDGIEELLLRNSFEPVHSDSKMWGHKQTTSRIRILSRNIIDISSTKIRSRIANSQPWLNFVPAKVGDYISNTGLYA